jgi:EmrB/QacA subfamily drug resistance transporter
MSFSTIAHSAASRLRSVSRPAAGTPSRWAILALLGVAQLMVVLDATVVNIALPSAQRALHFTATNRQWVITAYALAFGSLLLLGGKLGDLFGRKWTLIGGLTGFAVSSAIGGLAQSFPVLVAARASQGAFGALLAPSALGLLTVTFQGSRDRAKAFGIFSAIAAGGGSLGLLLGGALTQAISWRWSLYVNLVIAVPAAIAALRLIEHHPRSERPRFDVPGIAAGSMGLFALVYGFSHAETSSWSNPITIFALAASALLLTAFVAIELRVKHPLLPLHIVWDRGRGGAYATIALAGSAIFAVFLFLTYYLQQSLGFSPLKTGVAFLPMTVMIVLTATTVQTRILARTGAKPLVMTGMSLGVAAMIVLSRLSTHSSYAGGILPALLLVGLGMGMIFAPAFSTATLGVRSEDAGIASAMVNTAQQVGGSVGTALLSTIFASAAAAYASAHVHSTSLAGAAAIHGYSTAFEWAAVLFGVGLLVALLILPSKRSRLVIPAETPATAELSVQGA